VQLREHRVNLLDLLFVAQMTYRVLDLERLVDANAGGSESILLLSIPLRI